MVNRKYKNLVKTCGYVKLFPSTIQNIILIIFFSGYTKMKKMRLEENRLVDR